MFNYPVEKHIIRFYKYKLLGYENNPITIEANNKLQARQKLTYFLEKYPQYQGIPVISESLSLPIFGETVKEIFGLVLVIFTSILSINLIFGGNKWLRK
jgi:hypothetical protein